MSDAGSSVTLIFYRMRPDWWKEPVLNLLAAACQMSALTHVEIAIGGPWSARARVRAPLSGAVCSRRIARHEQHDDQRVPDLQRPGRGGALRADRTAGLCGRLSVPRLRRSSSSAPAKTRSTSTFSSAAASAPCSGCCTTRGPSASAARFRKWAWRAPSCGRARRTRPRSSAPVRSQQH